VWCERTQGIVDAIEKSKLKPGKDINICLDVAANELLNDQGKYSLNSSESISVEESINYYKKLVFALHFRLKYDYSRKRSQR
jgi:enolase